MKTQPVFHCANSSSQPLAPVRGGGLARLLGVSFVLLLQLVSGVGCSNEDLQQVPQDPVFERYSVEGTVCAPPSVDVDVPYRVLFVIDTSLSNEWNDPTKKRVEAVKNAINANISNENVSFGVITFSDVPRVQTMSFTRDLVSLDGATRNVGIAQGATNYSDSLWTAKTFIMEDLSAMTKAQAARTHYLVFWLTDGFPTVGTTDPGSLLIMTESWRKLLEDRVAEFRLETAFLGGRSSSAAEAAELASARDLLTRMATAGGGSFNDVAGGASFTFNIDLKKAKALYQLENVVAFNRNAVLDGDWPKADTDGDGLSDEAETGLQLNPLLDDTDADGYRDGLELFASASLRPTSPDTGCEDALARADGDGDGLRDCEEAVIGSSPTKPDSDGDGLPDGIEALSGSSPTDERSSTDRDGDGLGDNHEVRAHLRPSVHTSADQSNAWPYTYFITPRPTDPADPSSCYDVRVGNITFAATQGTSATPKGLNRIELHVGFALEGGVEPRWYGTSLEGRLLRSPNVSAPASGRFQVATNAFLPLRP